MGLAGSYPAPSSRRRIGDTQRSPELSLGESMGTPVGSEAVREGRVRREFLPADQGVDPGPALDKGVVPTPLRSTSTRTTSRRPCITGWARGRAAATSSSQSMSRSPTRPVSYRVLRYSR
jgi:hypothetical protein